MKEKFVKYKTYKGLNHTQCLVLSFIEMYGETYASNKHIGERLHISSRTVSRTLNEICEMGHIKVENPKGRSRNIIFINIDNMTTQHRQIVQQPRQYVQHNIDNMSNNEKENEKVYEKEYMKEYNIIAMTESDEYIQNYLKSKGVE